MMVDSGNSGVCDPAVLPSPKPDDGGADVGAGGQPNRDGIHQDCSLLRGRRESVMGAPGRGASDSQPCKLQWCSSILMCTGWLRCTSGSPTVQTRLHHRGDGVVQYVEHRTQDSMTSMTRGPNPVRSTRKMCEFFQVQNIVLTCCHCVPNPRVYTHA